jgi:hypothetical protein
VFSKIEEREGAKITEKLQENNRVIKFHGDDILWKKGLKKTGSRSGHLRKDKNKIRILLLKLGEGGYCVGIIFFFMRRKKVRF